MTSLDKITRRLHTAVKNGDTELTLSLIKQGASVTQKERFGYPPLHIAVRRGHTELALSLIEHGASVNQEGGNGRYICLPLHIAVRHGHTELALSLIEQGASVNQEDRLGNLPLHIAAKDDHTEVAVSLIEHGASVNRKDSFGDLPLHIAVKNGYNELALSLIKHGASVKKADGDGNLPLCICIEHGHFELVRSLIKHGASVNQSDKHGVLPIKLYFDKLIGDTKHFNGVIFTMLIPGRNMDILKTICQILYFTISNDTGKEHKLEVLSSMLHKLIQYLILVEPLCITIRWEYYYFRMELNQHVIVADASLKAVYLCSVIVILSGCNVSVVDAIAPQLSPMRTLNLARADYLLQASAIDDLWNAQKQKTGVVRKLQALCVQKTRQSMHSLSDESFQSLLVPPHLQKMLMLQDIADVLFEGYKMWPKCMPIEELI